MCCPTLKMQHTLRASFMELISFSSLTQNFVSPIAWMAYNSSRRERTGLGFSSEEYKSSMTLLSGSGLYLSLTLGAFKWNEAGQEHMQRWSSVKVGIYHPLKNSWKVILSLSIFFLILQWKLGLPRMEKIGALKRQCPLPSHAKANVSMLSRAKKLVMSFWSFMRSKGIQWIRLLQCSSFFS